MNGSPDDDLAALAAAGRLECAAAAQKLALAARIWRVERDADERAGVPAHRRSELVACEVATALSVSTAAARALIDLGDTLQHRLPGVRRALEQGRLDLGRVRVVASVDPASVVARRRRAEADRRVCLQPDLDGMTSVWGLLRAADGVLVDTRLRETALAVFGGDPRTLEQRRADALVAWADGRSELECRCGSSTCPTEPAARSARGPVVQVVVDVATLLGATDLPGVLARYGIVDPELVRTLAADARWRRVLTSTGCPCTSDPRWPPVRGRTSRPPGATSRRRRWPPWSAPGTVTAASRAAPSPPPRATSTTSSRSTTTTRGAAGRPARTTSPVCAGSTTGSRPCGSGRCG